MSCGSMHGQPPDVRRNRSERGRHSGLLLRGIEPWGWRGNDIRPGDAPARESCDIRRPGKARDRLPPAKFPTSSQGALMASTSSFDVTTGVDFMEVHNAVNQATKEITQRYDFKGPRSRSSSTPRRRSSRSRRPTSTSSRRCGTCCRASWSAGKCRSRTSKPGKIDAARRRYRAPGDHDPGGPQRGHGARDREDHQGREAEEGPGRDPGRHGARLLARARTTLQAGSHCSSSRTSASS